MHKFLTVVQDDGSVWGVPVEMIARSRATHYADEFGGDVERSLAEDTIPLFESSEFEIQDWAVNEMNWRDFDGFQVKIAEAPALDFQDAWCTGEKGFAEAPRMTAGEGVPVPAGLVYVAADPDQPGAAWAARVADLSDKRATANKIAGWLRDGATVMLVTPEVAREMMGKWVRPEGGR